MNPAQHYGRFPGMRHQTKASAAWDIMGMAAEVAKLNEADMAKADRAARLKDLFASEVWIKDVLPTLRQVYDEAFDEVRKKTVTVDALNAIDRIFGLLQLQLVTGFEAMQNIVARRTEQADAAAAAIPPLPPVA